MDCRKYRQDRCDDGAARVQTSERAIAQDCPFRHVVPAMSWGKPCSPEAGNSAWALAVFGQFLPNGSREKGPTGSEFPCIFPAVQGIVLNGTAADRHGEFSELLGLFAPSLCSPKYPADRDWRRTARLSGRWATASLQRETRWRRGWDSNPRNACALNGFRDRPDRPLRHLSVGDIHARSSSGPGR